jgi:4-oxalocrotonate tautomerase
MRGSASVPVSTESGETMPFIQVTMLEGRTVEQKQELMRKLNAAAAEVLGGDPSRIRIALIEVTGDDWGIGGESYTSLQAKG